MCFCFTGVQWLSKGLHLLQGVGAGEEGGRKTRGKHVPVLGSPLMSSSLHKPSRASRGPAGRALRQNRNSPSLHEQTQAAPLCQEPVSSGCQRACWGLEQILTEPREVCTEFGMLLRDMAVWNLCPSVHWSPEGKPEMSILERTLVIRDASWS